MNTAAQPSTSVEPSIEALLTTSRPSIAVRPDETDPSEVGYGLLVRSEEGVIVRNVRVPTLTPFLPDADIDTGASVIIAPGGGFHFLAWDYEGVRAAYRLAELGVAAYVLRYRLVDTGATEEEYAASMSRFMQKILTEALTLGGVDIPTMAADQRQLAIADGQDAVRLMRRLASERGADPGRVALVGFSAGAFVATGAALSDDPSARPDLVAAIYGGVAEGPIDASTPPLFAAVAADDLLCRRTCVDTARAWMEAGRPVELHLYETGGHGFGTRPQGLPSDAWIVQLENWLTAHGFVTPSAGGGSTPT